MTRSGGWLAFFLVPVVISIGALIGLGLLPVETAIIGLTGFAIISWIGFRMAGSQDQWFPAAVVAGYGAKVAGTAFYYWTVKFLYGGVADAVGYHDRALALVGVWREFQIPKSNYGSAGTRFVTETTSLLYIPHEPSLLGGFLIFATLSFFGQLLLYAAFRRALPTARLKLYAFGILFLPSLVYWPSTIGKDALMLLFIGLVAYGVSRFLLDYGMRWLLIMAAGLAGLAAIRPHVAALAAGALAIAVVLGRRPQVNAAALRWSVMASAAVLAAIFVANQASNALGIDLSGQNLDPLLQDLQRNSHRGGSAIEGEAVLTFTQLPSGVIRVLFRPLPYEAETAQGMMSAIENTLLLVVTIWKLPKMLIGLRGIRNRPYLMFMAVFVIGFVIMFSAIFNLGNLARQRTQALPFLLALIVGLGWQPEPPSIGIPEGDLVRSS